MHATVQQQSRWEFRRLPKTLVESFQLHIDSSFIVHNKQNGLGQGKAHRDSVPMGPKAVRNNKLMVEKIPSETNSSHLGTEHLTSENSEMLMKLVNCFCV